MTRRAVDAECSGEPASIAQFFDEMAVERNAIIGSHPVIDYEQRVRSRTVLRLLDAQREEAILDIGCGNARDILPMLRAGARIVGIDLSEGMIQQARQELAAAGCPDVELEVGDTIHLRFQAHSFDKVLCSEVIEHIPEASTALREIHKVLKPGGRLILSTPNRSSWYGFDRYVIWRLLGRQWNHPFDNWRNLRELHSLLEASGFRVTSSRTVCYVPGFVLTYFLPRYLQRAVVRGVRAVDRLVSRLAPGRGYLLVITAEAER